MRNTIFILPIKIRYAYWQGTIGKRQAYKDIPLNSGSNYSGSDKFYYFFFS